MRASILVMTAIATLASPATASTNHTRGIILGTTDTSLDIGLPNQDDVHFDMALRPTVYIAEPGDPRAIVVGALVGVVAVAGGRVRRVVGGVVIPKELHVFARGRRPWDTPSASHFTFGIVVRRSTDRGGVRATIADGRGGEDDVFIAGATPIATIRAGSRAALLSPQHCFVISHPEADGISDTIETVIVGDGRPVVPL